MGAILAIDEREKEAERNRHNNIENDLASVIAATVRNVNERLEIHGSVRMIQNER